MTEWLGSIVLLISLWIGFYLIGRAFPVTDYRESTGWSSFITKNVLIGFIVSATGLTGLVSIFGFSRIVWVIPVTVLVTLGFIKTIGDVLNTRKDPGKSPLILLFISTLFWILIIGFWLSSLLGFYLPGSTDAAGWGMLTVTLFKGHSVIEQLPYYPGLYSPYPPGFFVLSACLRDLTGSEIPRVMAILATGMGLMVLMSGWELGHRLGKPWTGLLVSVLLVLDSGLWSTFLDSGYTAIGGLLGLLAFFIYWDKSRESGKWSDIILSAGGLAVACLMSPDLLQAIILGIAGFIVAGIPLLKSHKKDWLISLLKICGLSVLMVLPWLIQAIPYLLHPEVGQAIGQYQQSLMDWRPGWHQWGVVLFYHSPLVVCLAVSGIIIAFWKRRPIDIFMGVWLILIMDLIGPHLLPSMFEKVGVSISRNIYYFMYGWRATIIPLVWLSAVGIGFFIETILEKKRVPLLGYISSIILIFISLWIITSAPVGENFRPPFYGTSTLSIPKAIKIHLVKIIKGKIRPLATHDEYQSMHWIRNNTPEDSLIVNENTLGSHWTLPMTERKTVYFREQPFWTGTKRYQDWQKNLSEYRKNPSSFKTQEIQHVYLLTSTPLGIDTASNSIQEVFSSGDAGVYRINE